MKKLDFDPIKTVLTICVGFIGVYIFLQKDSLKDAGFQQNWPLIVAFSIGAMGLLSSYLASKINFAWMKLTWVLSLIVPNIILSVVFYFFLTPIALLSKLFNKKDPLMLKNDKKSIFTTPNRIFDKESFEKPW